MEPCAPGTEDESPIMYSTLNKKENEQERLLSQKAFLRSGKYDNVFELTFSNGAEHWYCNACECPVMGRVFQHELGRRHGQNISKHYTVEKDTKESISDEPAPLEIAPGEPLPPGFEEIDRVSQIQERLDGFKVGPLVALEYLIELQDDDPSKEPFYLCILCDKKGDPRTVLTHLASYNHISQYLQKHFPTCWRVLAPYNTKQYRRNWQTTLQKLAEGIEKKFGRLRPIPIDKDKFEKDRLHYLQLVGKGRHFSEVSGYTFEELVVHDELTKSLEVEEKSYETSITNNWGNTPYIERPFKKRSPSPPVVNMPSKRNKGNAQTNPRKQDVAFTTQAGDSAINKSQGQPGRKPGEGGGGPQQNRAPLRRRSLSSVSSISDNSDDDRTLERDRGFRGRGRGRGRGGKPQFQRGGGRQPHFDEMKLPYGRRRSPTSPRRRSPVRRRSPSPRRRSPSPRRRSPFKRRSPSPNPTRRRSLSPTYKAEQEKEKLRKIEEFRKLGRAIENDMFKTLKLHEKSPEKHPQYNDEWKKFWNRRYKELKAEGVDVTKHDFKPEWIEFWNKRMVEIHSDELRSRKEALRKRLALPEEMNPIKFKIGTGPVTIVPDKVVSKPLPMAAQPDQDDEVIIIDDKDDDKDRKGAHSPWENTPPRTKGVPVRKPNKRSSSPRPKKSRDSPVRRPHDYPVKKGNVARFIKRSTSREKIPSRDRSRSRDKQFAKRRSGSIDRVRVRNASPISETSHTSRPTNRSSSKERFSGRRSRSKDPSRSGDKKPYVKQSLIEDRITSRDRNMSPISDDSEKSRSGGRHFRDSRSRSRNRSVSRNKGSPSLRRSMSRERSWERKRLVRESSFERDLRGRERIRTVADLPWERDAVSVYRNPYLPPPVMRDVTRKPVDSMVIPEDDDDGKEVNVVDVLRILTALEDRLGSLGPKVIDLLAQALALEKNEANSSEQLLDNEINCVLFETVKEKLKGQMFAGLVDHIQQRAFKKAIKKIASLMHLAGQRNKQREKLIPKLAPVNSSGAVDKAAIAKQIANALIAQGKTDVTQAELEQLINAVVGMAEASKVSSKPMTTAGFLEMLGGGFSSEKNQESQNKTGHRKPDIVDLEKLTEPLTPSPGRNSTNMENLSDSDLQTLLQNFKDLSTEEQHNLINYLKKLEYQEPDRVEKLRKFVHLDSSGKSKEDSKEDLKEDLKEDPKEDAKEGADDEEKPKAKSKSNGRESPFSHRSGGVNPASDDLVNIESDEENDVKEQEGDSDKETEKDKPDKKVNPDSEEDEYTFDDVVKTVSKNVKDKEMEHSKKVLEDTMKYDKSRSNLNSAKDLISELMSNISKSNSASSNTVDLLGLGKPQVPNPPSTSMANVDLSKLLNINVASLASIVNNVKNMSSNETVDKQLAFKPPSPAKNQHKLNFDLGQLKPDPTKLGLGGINRGHAGLNRDIETSTSLDKDIGAPGFDRPLPGGQNRFDGPGGQDFDREPFREELGRFGPGPDRFGPGGGSDRFGPGSTDRFGMGGNDRFGPGGNDRFGPGGPDRFGSMGLDRYGPGDSDRFGPGGSDRFGPGGSDRFGPGGSDRFEMGGSDRFGPGGPDRFAQGGPDRFRPGGPDRFGPGGPDRLGPGGPDRLGPGGPDRLGPGGPDRLGPGGVDRLGPGGPGRLEPGGADRLGPGGPDRFGPGGPDRFGPGGPDRLGPGGAERFGAGGPERFGQGGPERFGQGGPERFGQGGPERFGQGGPEMFGQGGPERFGQGGPERFGSGGLLGFGGPDRGFGGSDRLAGPGVPDRNVGGPGLSKSGLSGPGGPRMSTPSGPRMGGPGMGGQFRPNVVTDKGPGNFGSRPAAPFGNDQFNRGQPRQGPNDQRNFQRLPAPDFNRTDNNFNRW